MVNNWTDKWNERYGSDAFAYGEAPNEFLKERLANLTAGSILFPAEGEGRNAVYAATQGWKVEAFDISTEGEKKAKKLAEKQNVTINYQVGELEKLNYVLEQFDVIALIYAHFPANIKSQLHIALDKYLRKGGTVIFEAFSKNHLDFIAKNENVGGPRDEASLFSEVEIRADFANYDIIELKETIINLSEGLYHNGQASVIRFVGMKK